MNLLLDSNNYNVNNLFFYEPVKNTVIDESKFIRIIYSDENIILNGLYLKIDIKNNNTESILEYINNIENDILLKYSKLKIKIVKLKEQLQYFIKKNTLNNIILKLSGIWETNNMIGLTYKFIIETN